MNAPVSEHFPIAQLDISPLFERPPAHFAPLHDLLAWRKWAQDLALSVGSNYFDADGGPDASELLQELEWMLDDTVSDCSFLAGSNSVLSNVTETKKWRNIKNLCKSTSGALEDLTSSESGISELVNLRASLEELSALWTQRVKHRRPFQYVVGCAHWRDFVLCVREGVLIPRPETEQMIDLAEDAIKAFPSLANGLWADLGTGSGALAIGLGHLLDSQASVVAVDISDVAVSIARHNVQRYGLQNKVEVINGSWFAVLEDKKGKLAGVLSNPPYIPSHQIDSLQAEVAKYEPRNALDGGPQGTNDLITICQGASWTLGSHGYLILETNGGEQAEIIAKVLQSLPEATFYNVQVVKDFAGIMRFVTAIHV